MWSAFLCYQGYIEFRLDFNLLINYNIKIDFFDTAPLGGCTALHNDRYGDEPKIPENLETLTPAKSSPPPPIGEALVRP